VLTILRNRVYLGEIYFRGRYNPAPHEPLADPELYERAQQILTERGEDHSLRRSNQSDYLLTGLVRCARCGKRYLGAAAHGRGDRYPYYVCFFRQRYGRARCENDRPRADALEEAILDQLLRLLANSPLVEQAIQQAFAQLEGLRARRDELAVDQDDLPRPLSQDDLDALRARVSEVIEHGDPPSRKTLLQALIHDIQVVDRSEIRPVFSLPAVRRPSVVVPPAGFEPAISCVKDVPRGGRMRVGCRNLPENQGSCSALMASIEAFAVLEASTALP
jgi:hypothetical protein